MLKHFRTDWPSRYSDLLALLCHATLCRIVALRLTGLGGVSPENRATPPEKGPVSTYLSALQGGVALQVASWKVSRYRGVSKLHCRLSRYRGPLSFWSKVLVRTSPETPRKRSQSKF